MTQDDKENFFRFLLTTGNPPIRNTNGEPPTHEQMFDATKGLFQFLMEEYLQELKKKHKDNVDVREVIDEINDKIKTLCQNKN